MPRSRRPFALVLLVVLCAAVGPPPARARAGAAPGWGLQVRLVDPDAPVPALADLLAGAVGGAEVGGLQWPVAGPVTSGFGVRRHPVTGEVRLHAGIDVGAPTGTPIRAAAAGRVVASGARGGYGLVVDVDHGGLVTRYAHASRLLVGAGDAVAAGQHVALVGATGTATGPHLHLEVLLGGQAQDPQRWLP